MTETEYMAKAQALNAKLYRAALAYLGGEAAAVDAVDEAIYKGFRAYKKLRQEEFFDTWLTRILLNVCAGEAKRRKRETAMDALPETAQEEYDALPLKEAVARLPQGLKDVIILRYFTGLTIAETAQSLGLPPGTVSTRARRALALLRLELSDEDNGRPMAAPTSEEV